MGVATLSGSVTGGTLGATSGAVAAGIGGAAGALASQGVMIAGGEQHGLNFASITLGAISAGVTAGIGAAAGAPGSAWSAAAQGAVRSAATQGIGVVTGLQERFDWKGVAASAIASGVGYGVGEQVGKTVIGAGVGADLGRFASGVAGGLSAGVASTLVRGGSLGRNIGAIAADAVASTVGNMVSEEMASRPTSSASSLYGPGSDVNAMTANAVRAYGGDPGQQFANQANWNLQLDAGLREQAFVGGLQDQFGQLANDALAASRAENAALKQRLGSEFAGSANWALAQQRAEHAVAARQAAATRSGLAGFDLGRGANDWSDDAGGFDPGRGGWSNDSTLSRAAQWLDRPIQPLQALADTVRRGNAMMADGLDAVGLSGLAGAQRFG
ncbi:MULTISPECIES: hypothetical protein [Burkholderia]|uniref:hypothetical protein n=1 Tax=Burkholderia TaxID=32008 RepID=UPI001065DD2E|nr:MULTISPECIES: hypothetical protein [Burkholderia]MDP9546303.1 hypothetical protein [Burkholderia cepacia]MBR8389982.1 hypothetical protein [Burkholderia cenocepacia]MBR8469710.1 hypothetical protein [Burkholderia cenocepacia]MBR8487974.1 hypothetical protein [Burkholderia cenocepacia]MDO5919185.1 hypothetical protein [Burkholderia cenocepacia]